MSNDALQFHPSPTPLTLGVEMELQVLDAATLRLAPRVPEILARFPDPHLTKEMFRSTLEIVSCPSANTGAAVAALTSTIDRMLEAVAPMGIRFAGTGTNPMADYNERIVSAAPRYHELLDRNQWLIRRMAVYGLHVHVGMASGDDCIRFGHFFLHLVPHLVALSASSPFWRAHDTGLAASRPTTYEAHPTSGLPVLVKDWREFNDVYDAMVRTGSIQSMKDLWWDLRPSPAYGTLELRVCDGPATMLELGAIVAFVHAAARWFQENGERYFRERPALPTRWVLRENKWRALRYGLEAEIIDHRTMQVVPLREDLERWLDDLQPILQSHGDGHRARSLRDIGARGNSAQRQRAVYRAAGCMDEVVRFNVREFEARAPLWDELG